MRHRIGNAFSTFAGMYRLAIILWMWPVFGFAQQDTIIELPEVELSASRYEQYTFAEARIEVDSTALALRQAASLDEILQDHTGFFVKNYGVSNLSTLSVRGTDASHTSLLWNGINLLNPMNGVVDFSLIPVELFDRITIDDTGNSALSAGPSLGGVVSLENTLNNMTSGFSGRIGAGAGSFKSYKGFGNIRFQNHTWRSGIGISHHQAKNNFPLSRGGRQVNSGLKKFNVLQNNRIRLSERQSLRTFVWWQDADRQIAPPLLGNNDQARQRDKILRSGASWQNIANKSMQKLRAAYIDEQLLFFSDLIDTADSRVQTFVVEAEQDLLLNATARLHTGINFTAHRVTATDLKNTPIRNRISGVTGWKNAFLNNSLFINTNGRIEYFSDLKSFFWSGNLALRFRPGTQWQLYGRFSKNYKVPTFNDLYWVNAGNPELKAENGWSAELGFNYRRAFGPFLIDVRTEIFNNNIENWIQWLPYSGTFWRPVNHLEVWSRGIENTAVLRGSKDKWNWSVALHHSYVRSTITAVRSGRPVSLIGNQLIYVPEHNAGLRLSLGYGNWLLRYQHHYIGSRFTTPDNSGFLKMDAFSLGNLAAAYSFSTGADKILLSLHVRNLWAADYQVVRSRPMPLRHFELLASYQF